MKRTRAELRYKLRNRNAGCNNFCEIGFNGDDSEKYYHNCCDTLKNEKLEMVNRLAELEFLNKRDKQEHIEFVKMKHDGKKLDSVISGIEKRLSKLNKRMSTRNNTIESLYGKIDSYPFYFYNMCEFYLKQNGFSLISLNKQVENIVTVEVWEKVG